MGESGKWFRPSSQFSGVILNAGSAKSFQQRAAETTRACHLCITITIVKVDCIIDCIMTEVSEQLLSFVPEAILDSGRGCVSLTEDSSGFINRVE